MISLPFRVVILFVVNGRRRKLKGGVRVLVLRTSAVIALVFFFSLFIINGRCLAVIIRILIKLLANFVVLHVVNDLLVEVCSILFVRLYFRRLRFVYVDAFRVPCFPAHLHSMLVSRRRVKVFVCRHEVVFGYPFVVSYLVRRRAAIRGDRRVIKLRFSGGVGILGDPIIVTCLYAWRTPIVVTSRVVKVGVRYGVVIARHSSRIVLVMANRDAISVGA